MLSVPVNQQSTYQFHEKELMTLFRVSRSRQQLLEEQIQVQVFTRTVAVTM